MSHLFRCYLLSQAAAGPEVNGSCMTAEMLKSDLSGGRII